MRTPGIDVRPIRTIDGGAHFSEIFYEDVRIPIENVVDEINEGWSVAMSTLAIERGPAALDYQLGTLRDIDALIERGEGQGAAARTTSWPTGWPRCGPRGRRFAR